jgi:hypothetical protein
MESPPRRSPLVTLLATALAAAALNLATALLAHPLALAEPVRLGLPLVAGWAACLALAGVVLAAGRSIARLARRAVGALDAALAAALVLAAALAPAVEVGLRDASAERAGVVLATAAGFVACAAWALYGAARDAHPARLRAGRKKR